MFNTGQIFENTYPVEAAQWCNANNSYIEEIDPLEDGTRRFEIKEVKAPEPYVESESERKERISKLSMKRGDMFEALILAFGKDENDILAIIDSMEDLSEIDKKLYSNRVKNAVDFYRSYPAVDLVGAVLGVTSDQMDNFFESRDYNDLLSKKEK